MVVVVAAVVVVEALLSFHVVVVFALHTIFIPGAFDLIGRGGGGPDEVFRELVVQDIEIALHQRFAQGLGRPSHVASLCGYQYRFVICSDMIISRR